MSKTRRIIEGHVSKLNSLAEKHKDFFVQTPIFRIKDINKAKEIYAIVPYEPLQIILKSEFNNPPYIEFWEEWHGESRKDYSYRFVAPFFNFVYAFDGNNSNTKLDNFQFRYEIHSERSTYQKAHLHFFDNNNLSPHYPVINNIDFEEFFEIITREFIDKSSKKINFAY